MQVVRQAYGAGRGPNGEAGYSTVTQWPDRYDIEVYRFDAYGNHHTYTSGSTVVPNWASVIEALAVDGFHLDSVARPSR